ncbi:MAG: glycosyltransferase [Leptospira sp.]|nr:glycosyltransferase [Leptospira sp.]
MNLVRKIIYLYFQYSFYLRNYFHQINKKNKIPSINPLISILVPIYNTDKNQLKQMLESVINQKYKSWELILWDDASPDSSIEKTLKNYVLKDSRIYYFKSKLNSGIAKTTKLAFEKSKGDYITFLDHDDTLDDKSLQSIVIHIEKNKKSDFIYSDEIYNSSRFGIFSYSIKTPFSLTKLISNNYICHQVTVSRNLLKKMGGYREGFDGSQDHEFALRASRFTNHITFLPKHLYNWRLQKSSFSHKKKQICIDSSHKAIREQCLATNQKLISIKDGYYPFTYHIQNKTDTKSNILIVYLTDGVIKNSNKLQNSISKILKTINKINTANFLIPQFFKSNSFSKRFDIGNFNSNLNNLNFYNSNENLHVEISNTNFDHILFLHSSLEPLNDDWLYELIQMSNGSDIGAITPVIINSNKELIYSSILLGKNGFLDKTGNKLNRFESKIWSNEWIEKEVSAISKNSFFVSRKIWNKFNKIKKVNFSYNYWDVDFSLRLQEVNLKILSNPFSIFSTDQHSLFQYLKLSNETILDAKSLYKQWGNKLFSDHNYSPHANLLGLDMYPRGVLHDWIYKSKNNKILKLLNKS